MRGAQTHSTSLEAALAYAAQGYAVLPLQPGEKRPHPRLVPHGLKEASRDVATLAAWWRACPWCDWGFPEDPGPYTLDRDQEQVIFCPRCGAENPLPEEAEDA